MIQITQQEFLIMYINSTKQSNDNDNDDANTFFFKDFSSLILSLPTVPQGPFRHHGYWGGVFSAI